MSKSNNELEELKTKLRERIVEVWHNPDNPPEDKLIDIFMYSTEQLVLYLQDKPSD